MTERQLSKSYLASGATTRVGESTGQDLPARIGKYTVRGVAGRGAMGQVYFGHDPFIDRAVAIKVCSDGASNPAGDRTRRMFLNEAQAAGALDHPNILRIYDADEADEQLFIVMEYVEGGNNLKRYCEPDTLLPIESIVDYMEQCALALDYAHINNVLHRDIKPENILLTKESVAKVADFGIAQRLKMEATVAHGLFGSPLYMSPEQIEGEELTGQTDLYSLGVSMFQLLAGRPPFLADSVNSLVAKIVTQAPPNIVDFRPDLPDAISAVVMKAIQKPLDMRFASGAEMAAALAHARAAAWGDAREVDESELRELAVDLSFFATFSDSETAQVLDIATWRRFAPYESLVTEGSLGGDLFIITTGTAVVCVNDRSVAELGPGDCVGELSYLTGERRSASVVAQEDVWALQIDEPLVEWASMPVQVRFAKTFQQVMAERIRRTSRSLAAATR